MNQRGGRWQAPFKYQCFPPAFWTKAQEKITVALSDSIKFQQEQLVNKVSITTDKSQKVVKSDKVNDESANPNLSSRRLTIARHRMFLC